MAPLRNLRTGELQAHRRGDLLARLAPVAYDPAAQAPRWVEFLATVTGEDQQLADYLGRAVGAALAGEVTDILFLLHGLGANGKSTFLRVVLELLGDYAKQTEPELLLARRGEVHPTGLADLVGVRMAVCVEVEAGRRLHEVLIKQLTGGDRLTAGCERTSSSSRAS